MSSDRIRWTQDERDAIVDHAVRFARGGVISRLEALNLGMKAALLNQERHRNCVSTSHFGSYINAEFDRRLHQPEKIGNSLPKIGRTADGEVRAPAEPRGAEAAHPVPVAAGIEADCTQVLADDEEIVLNFPDVVIPSSILNRIAAYVEARVMTRVMAIMQATQSQPLQVKPETRAEVEVLPKEAAPACKPEQDGAKLQVIVIGFMPQRKQWLLSAIPARLRNRLDIEFYYENFFERAAFAPRQDHIVIHCTMKGRSEVPIALQSPGRYYRSALSPGAVLSNIETAADYHLLKMDQQ